MGRTTTTTTTATATATATRRSTRLAIKVEDTTQDAATKALTKTSAKAKAKTASTSTAKATPKAAVKKAGKAAGKTAGKTAGKELAKTTRAKKVGKEPAVPKATRAKKQTPSEPAASRQRKRKQDQVDTAADEAPVVKPTKRPRKSKNAETVALKQENHDVEIVSTTAPPRPRNRTDPCELLPTEVWHQVLSLLPLSQAATSSLVSKAWLDGARAWPVWKQICEASKLGKPKRKYKTYMSLVCAQSYFICDKCHSFSHGIKVFNASGIPLPVDVIVKKAEKPKTEQAQGQAENKDTSKGTNNDTAKDDKGNNKAVEKEQEQDKDQKPQDQGQSSADSAADDQASGDIVERWNLCRDCRTAYYLDYPEEYRRLPGESEDDWEHRRSDRITKTRACSTYYLTEEDLAGLDYREVRNPHHRSWYPMRLFDRHDIQDRALDIHGGWVGVDACTKGIARARRLACKLRDAAVLGDSAQPRKTRVKKEDLTQGASQEAAQGLGSTQVQLLELKLELETQLANSAVFTTSGMTPMSAMPTMPTMPVVAAGAQ
ncbi:hypothetical protein BGZ67_001672 [Mortierella alpina]|nr:hypothetical protein BGZ67_001672 [Mortierella alpina]